MERVKRHFSQDLNTEWESWPWTQRRNMIDSFLKGMTQADYNHTTTPKDVDHLAEKSWPELLRTFIEVDRVIGPRSRRFKHPSEEREEPPTPRPPTPPRTDYHPRREAPAQPAHPTTRDHQGAPANATAATAQGWRQPWS